jgi:2-C-methyl-D-erythritol 2,4-cyclodiphosphate synthase
MVRTGIGYDIHRFVQGRKLILGGVDIPHVRGLDGHSAAGDRDIGHHFPNSDESIKGIDSQEILRRVQAILTGKSFAIVNIDSSLIAEEPKIGPHISAMRERLAQTLNIPADRIGIKATTNEGLGFIGRGEGIAAMAIATLEKLEPRFPADAPRALV